MSRRRLPLSRSAFNFALLLPIVLMPIVLGSWVGTMGIAWGTVNFEVVAPPIVGVGTEFDVDVRLSNPDADPLGGYQASLTFDATRYQLVSLDGPSEIAEIILGDLFSLTAPAPVGSGSVGCPQWGDATGIDVISVLGLATRLPNGYVGTGGLLFRARFLALGPADTVTIPPIVDSFAFADGFVEGCLEFTDVTDPTGTIGYSLTTTNASVVQTDVPSPESFTCDTDTTPGFATLIWSNPGGYDQVLISRDGVAQTLVPGTTTQFFDDESSPGNTYSYTLAGVLANGLQSFPVACEVTVGLAPVINLACAQVGNNVELTWTVPGDAEYDTIEIYRDTLLLAAIPGNATFAVDNPMSAGLHSYEVIPRVVTGTPLTAPAEQCQINYTTTVATPFIRGDSNFDGSLEPLTDGLFLLNYLFTAGTNPQCDDSADVDDSGSVALVDAVYVLNFGFVAGSPVPPAPFPDAGVDPTADTLGCAP